MNDAAVRGGAAVIIEAPDAEGRIAARPAVVVRRTGRRCVVRFDDGREEEWDVGLFADTVTETTANELAKLERARVEAERLAALEVTVAVDGEPTVKLPGGLS